jgi:preprotein translocase subunit SecF
VPVAVDLKIRDPLIKTHTARVLAKRKSEGLVVDADGDPIRRVGPPPSSKTPARGVAAVAVQDRPVTASTLKPGAAPKPGAKPVRPPKPTGSAGSGAKPSGKGGGRPSGKRSR